jgi:hypothetical protein
MMNKTNSESKVIVLDCCYSGAGKLGMGGEDDTAKLAGIAMNKK